MEKLYGMRVTCEESEWLTLSNPKMGILSSAHPDGEFVLKA
jgi:hypothetical protein